jgi:hypothetical protein
MACKTNLRLVGWMPVAASAASIVIGLGLSNTFWRSEGSTTLTLRVIETIVPFVGGLQTAFLLSPEDEAPLEILLSCPRPVCSTLLERLITLLVMHGSVALIGNLVLCAFLKEEGLLTAILRWWAPYFLLSGVALFTTQLTRQGSFGTLLETLMWGGMLFGGDALLRRWAFLWPIHVFLQPQDSSATAYLLNRATLLSIGMILTALGLYWSGNEERMLIGRNREGEHIR